MSRVNVLIVGAGITGSVVAFELRRLFVNALATGKMAITIWDKARGPGIASYFDEVYFVQQVECRRDVLASNQAFCHEFYDDLENAGLLINMRASILGNNPYSGEGVQDMVCPKGNSAIVKYFLQNSGVSVQNEHLLRSLDLNSAARISANLDSEASHDIFDVVVLTMPVPQIFQLGGNVFDKDVLETLRTEYPVEYSSRYTLILFFPQKTYVGLDFGFSFVDDEVIRYIAVDNIKRGALSDPAAVVLHSTWQFGKQNIDGSKEVAEQLMTERFYLLFPDVPRTEMTKIHKWRYSQVRSRPDGEKAAGYAQLSPAVFCAGDGFTGSSLEQCFDSAVKVSAAIYEAFRDRA